MLFTRPTEELGAPAYRKFDMEVPSWLPFVESEFPFFMWGNLGKLRPVIGAAWFVWNVRPDISSMLHGQNIELSISISISLYLYISTSLSLYLYISISLYLYISISLSNLSIYLSIYLPTYLAIYLSIYLPIYLSIYLPICICPYTWDFLDICSQW